MSNWNACWLEPWLPLLDRATLAQRMALSPPPLSGLDKLPSGLAAKALDDALREVFQVSNQVLDLSEILVATAVHHLQTRYKNADTEYPCKVNSRITNEEPDFIAPIPVTGHAGVGKSAIFKALRRALGAIKPLSICGINVRPEPLKVVPVGIAKSQLAVVRRMGGMGKTLEECSPSAQRILYRDGTALISFGEMQFVNQSANANTLVAGILLHAGGFGVPTAYDANFSLMWRLRRRPPEERDRLLCDPIVLLPDVPASPDSMNLSSAMFGVAPEVFKINVQKDGGELDKRCGGLKRLKRRLLVLAYQRKRELCRDGAVRVTIDDVRAAYESNAFMDARLIVEELWLRQDRTRRREDDLCCPFDEPLSIAQARAIAARELRNERVAERELEDAMTCDEKRLVADRAKPKGTRARAPGKVSGLGSQERATSAERAANSAALAAEFS